MERVLHSTPILRKIFYRSVTIALDLIITPKLPTAMNERDEHVRLFRISGHIIADSCNITISKQQVVSYLQNIYENIVYALNLNVSTFHI